jgi:hypothetical protein
MLVDWLKHAFIAKFNHVRSTVYGRYADVLAKDVLLAGSLGRSRSRNKAHNVSCSRFRLNALPYSFSTPFFSINPLSWRAGWVSPPFPWLASSYALVFKLWGCSPRLHTMLTSQ